MRRGHHPASATTVTSRPGSLTHRQHRGGLRRAALERRRGDVLGAHRVGSRLREWHRRLVGEVHSGQGARWTRRGRPGAGPGFVRRRVGSCTSTHWELAAPSNRCSIDGQGGGEVERSKQRTSDPLRHIDADLQHTTLCRFSGDDGRPRPHVVPTSGSLGVFPLTAAADSRRNGGSAMCEISRIGRYGGP